MTDRWTHRGATQILDVCDARDEWAGALIGRVRDAEEVEDRSRPQSLLMTFRVIVPFYAPLNCYVSSTPLGFSLLHSDRRTKTPADALCASWNDDFLLMFESAPVRAVHSRWGLGARPAAPNIKTL